MEALLRKYFWLVDFAVAGLAAIFMARATASMAEAEFARMTPQRKPDAVAESAREKPAPSKEIGELLARNVFCSSCPPFEDPVETPAAGEPGAVVQDPATAEPEKTSMPVMLVAIMFAPPPTPPWHSLAVIKDTEVNGAGAYGVGDIVRDAKVIEIAEQRVLFDNRGRLEYLDLLAEPAPPPTEEAPKPRAKEEGGGRPQDELAAELDRGLKKTGEHAYELQRSTLEQVLGNMSLLSRSARIVPEMRDGKPAGFRLYSVRPEGPFAKIGMMNGDVIYAINGLEMASPDKALAVYSKLKSARHLSVSLERNGQKITKEYTIR